MNPQDYDAGGQIREIARQLLLHYATAADSFSEPNVPPFRALEALRRPLSTLIGVQGCRVLLARALTLAKAKETALRTVSVEPDCSFVGFGDLSSEEASAAGTALLAQVLNLLATFIGKDLMLRILLSVWPDLSIPDTNYSGESES